MLTLRAQKRDTFGKSVKSLRNKGMLPCVMYGQGTEAQSLTVVYNEFEKVFKTAGYNQLVTLEIEGDKPVEVLIYEKDKDAVTSKVLHADFYVIDPTKPLTTDIPVIYVNESLAVKDLGGVLRKRHNFITITCLPKDLIHEIKIDLSKLEKLNDSIRIKDLALPATSEIDYDLEETIVSVTEAKKIVEEAPVVAAPVEGAAPAEGAAAAPAEGAKKEGDAAKAEEPKKEEKKK